jgi:hypothetical protein
MKEVKTEAILVAPCGECKFYDSIHNITPTLSEGWCRVDKAGATLVLSEETCNKWQVK